MRIVIKIGTSTLTHQGGFVNIRKFDALCRVISDIKNAGNEVILVSSGSIAMGVAKLNLGKRPDDIATKQACAAVGQCELMYLYDKRFAEYHHTVAQILLTAPDLSCEDRHAKFDNTMNRLLALGALPVINENDTVATEEIEFGDNDTLAARIAASVKADLLVLLSDIDGLFTGDPRLDKNATLIPEVHKLDDSIMALAGGAGTSRGTGGMQTKLRAARIACEAGCDMIITNGERPDDLYAILDNGAVGTRFFAERA